MSKDKNDTELVYSIFKQRTTDRIFVTDNQFVLLETKSSIVMEQLLPHACVRYDGKAVDIQSTSYAIKLLTDKLLTDKPFRHNNTYTPQLILIARINDLGKLNNCLYVAKSYNKETDSFTVDRLYGNGHNTFSKHVPENKNLVINKSEFIYCFRTSIFDPSYAKPAEKITLNDDIGVEDNPINAAVDEELTLKHAMGVADVTDITVDVIVLGTDIGYRRTTYDSVDVLSKLSDIGMDYATLSFDIMRRESVLLMSDNDRIKYKVLFNNKTSTLAIIQYRVDLPHDEIHTPIAHRSDTIMSILPHASMSYNSELIEPIIRKNKDSNNTHATSNRNPFNMPPFDMSIPPPTQQRGTYDGSQRPVYRRF